MLETFGLEITIFIKLIVGMIGVLLYLRVSGKSQMSQMTPADIVSSFVIGAIVGGTIYAPNLSVWYMIFGLIAWTVVSYALHLLTKIPFFYRFFYGSVTFIVKGGALQLDEMRRNKMDAEQLTAKLREQRIFSLMDVDDVRLETDGQMTVFLKTEKVRGFLLISEGNILEENLKDAGKSEAWLQEELGKIGIQEIESLYCVEWTPGRGVMVVDDKGKTITVTE